MVSLQDILAGGADCHLSRIVPAWAQKRPHQVALFDQGKTWTYQQLADEQARMAALLQACGVRPGDRVMIVGENCAAQIISLFAIATLDAWVVMVNARLSAREIDTIREHCGARRTLYMAHTSAEAAAHAERHKAAALDLGEAGVIALSDLNPHCEPEPVSRRGDEQVAALIYTTGTTGNPKAVMLTHRNLLFAAGITGSLRDMGEADCAYTVLPLSHVFGFTSVCLCALLSGGSLYLEPRFSPDKMIHAIRHQGITVCQAVPAMYAKVIDVLKTRNEKIQSSQLRFIYAGGSPLDAALKTEVEEYFGLPLNNGYGLTESSPTITLTNLSVPRTDCSVGYPIPHVEIRIVGHDGQDVPAGQQGELWARGPNVMKGYYQDLDLTANTINAAGWLNTGDLARIDETGAVFIVGRSKELIIRSGFNVYPVEVESVLNAHPDVTQSAVVGRDVPGNEEVVAFVELAPGATADPAALKQYAAGLLAPYKCPAEIIILPALPAAASGKILKHQLKKMAAQ